MEFYKASRRSKEDTIKRLNSFKESEEYKSMSKEDKEMFDNAFDNLQAAVNIIDVITNSALANGAMSKYPKQPKEPKELKEPNQPKLEEVDKQIREKVDENLKGIRNGEWKSN